MQGELYCTTCHKDTPHTVTYLNNKIKKIGCNECMKFIGNDIDFTKEMYQEIVERVSSKPFRLAKEFDSDRIKFIRDWPARFVKKPFGIINYLKMTKNSFKNSK